MKKLLLFIVFLPAISFANAKEELIYNGGSFGSSIYKFSDKNNVCYLSQIYGGYSISCVKGN